MRWFKAEYQWRGQGAGHWGHTVRLTENPEHKSEKFYGTTIDPEEIEGVLEWANENSNARRISYDTWQFKSAEEANQFIMIYNLRWS
jgi:hypothetical protein